ATHTAHAAELSTRWGTEDEETGHEKEADEPSETGASLNHSVGIRLQPGSIASSSECIHN
ncbi:MAG: hypothetical protein AAGJ83_02560, partial [Planctomycetota bacterium]